MCQSTTRKKDTASFGRFWQQAQRPKQLNYTLGPSPLPCSGDPRSLSLLEGAALLLGASRLYPPRSLLHTPYTQKSRKKNTHCLLGKPKATQALEVFPTGEAAAGTHSRLALGITPATRATSTALSQISTLDSLIIKTFDRVGHRSLKPLNWAGFCGRGSAMPLLAGRAGFQENFEPSTEKSKLLRSNDCCYSSNESGGGGALRILLLLSLQGNEAFPGEPSSC